MDKHQWICTKAGMFVSLFQCKKCNSETRDPHDRLECGPVRLSNFAQDKLLRHIYSLKDIDEAEHTTFEKQLLALAQQYDKQHQPRRVICTCGEDDEAFTTLTSPQHSQDCPKYGA